MRTKIEEQITRYLNANRAVMIWGNPGTGKTAAVESAVKRLHRKMAYYHPISAGEIGARGMPSMRDGKLLWSEPTFLEEVREGADVIFIDEINIGREAMALTMRIVNERLAGTHRIPEHVSFVCAGNSPEQTMNDMPVALANRLAHIHHEVKANDFFENFISWGPAEESGARAAVIAFLKVKSDLICGKPIDNGAYPTPRSWAMFSAVAAKSPRSEWREIATECVGAGAANDAGTFWKTMNLRSREQIAQLLKAGAFEVQPEMSSAYAEAQVYVGMDDFHDLLRAYLVAGRKAVAKAAQIQHTEMFPKIQLPRDLAEAYL